MAYSDRIKEARIANKMTQKELAEKIGVGATTVTGYEKGNSEPNMLTFRKIMDVLNVDANFLFQDEMNGLTELVISLEEKNSIKKYRDLDDHGKKIVDFVLEEEYIRSTSSTDPSDIVADEIAKELDKEESEVYSRSHA